MISVLLESNKHEQLSVFLLDSQHLLIVYEEMFRGTLSSTVVHPREIVKAALKHDAAAVILAHNHPSGMLEPSQADIQITNRIKEALALVDIQVIDHFIAIGTTTVSMVETPPRVWGRLSKVVAQTDLMRNTPTRVGKTRLVCICAGNIRKHPHACGEDALKE